MMENVFEGLGLQYVKPNANFIFVDIEFDYKVHLQS